MTAATPPRTTGAGDARVQSALPPRPLTGRGAALVGAALPGVLSVAAVLALWEVAPRVGWVRETLVPPFSVAFVEALRVLADPDFATEVAASGSRWLLGLGIAAAIGIPLGLLMGRSRAAFLAVDPVLVLLYPVPKAAFILLFVLWFGAGTFSQVLVIVLGSIIPIVISAYHGAAAVDPKLLWSARALGVPRRAELGGIVLPAALPTVLSGVRIAITLSLFTMLASELLIRESGIGAYLFNYLDIGQVQRVWGTSLVIATIGFLLDLAFVAAVRRSVRWWEGEV